ncbi:flagellar export protein FliJ [bacterium]|nr:flagellar export protein FliJ [bacterium]
MAKGFKFRLQTVLDLAVRVQDQKAQLLAEAQAKVVTERDRHAALVEAQVRARQDLLDMQAAGPLDLQAMQFGHDHMGRLIDAAHHQLGAIAQAERAAEVVRAELMTAAQKVQVLEKLKASAKAEYQRKIDQAEARFIDELATIRFPRTNALNFPAPPPKMGEGGL